MGRRYVPESVWVECKVPDENGRYSDHGETIRRKLTWYQAVKQWARESMLDSVVPRALQLEVAMQLIQKHWALSREPAYNRALWSVSHFDCLSFEQLGFRKFIVYKSELDKHEEVGTNKLSLSTTPKPQEPPMKDIYAMLVALGEKRKLERTGLV